MTIRILSSVGNLRRVARLVLRISARAVSAERVGPAVAASLLPVSGELNAQMCSLTSGLKLSHFR